MRKQLLLAIAAITLSGCGSHGARLAQANVPAGLKPTVSSMPGGILSNNGSGIVSNNGSSLAKPQRLADGATFVRFMAASSDNTDVKVITFNTACGNPAIKTKQSDFLQLPFYLSALQGQADAPILCLQEVGNEQHDAIEAWAKKNPNFTFRYLRVGTRQGNMIVVPKRYTVLEYDGTYYGWVQVKAAAKAVWNWIGPGDKPNLSQLVEPRGFQEAKVRDNVTGNVFMLYNTHVSFQDGIKEPQAKKLFDRIGKNAKTMPVILGGDLNVRTEDTDTLPAGDNAKVRAMFGDLKDMGPVGRPPYKTNIDWVLARGFSPVSSKWYTGSSISLPGSPDALTVSDHYAEEDVLRFE